MNFHDDIIRLTKENNYFRQVLETGKNSQVVIMSIPPGGEIGEETHDDVDQVLIFIEGEGSAILNDEAKPVAPNHLVFVPMGTKHNFTNTGSVDLKLISIYAPPEHAPGTIHKTKAEANQAHS